MPNTDPKPSRTSLLRMTIARKIALAVVAIVALCVGTMAWITSQNLNRGFLTYLDQLQLRELAPARDAITARYRQEGNFDWLRRDRAAMRKIMDETRGSPQNNGEGARVQREGPGRFGEPWRGRDGREGRDDREWRGRNGPPPDFGPPPHDAPPGEGRWRPRPPPDGRGYDGPPRDGPRHDEPPPPEGPPAAENGPPNADPVAGSNNNPPGADNGVNRNRPRGPLPGQTARDPLGYGSRLSIVDAQGQMVIGPRPLPGSGVLPIIVDGKVVGNMYLAKLEQIGAAENATNAVNFVRGQMRDTAWLAAGLILVAILLAVLLARHFLRPIAALRKVTERIARGQFSARAPVLGSDELAQLAAHVNQMAADLERSEQQRRQMMADIAHELRTPLTVVRGEIEALLDGIRKLDRKAMESLHTEVLRLNKMVDDVHQLTLADVGDLHFHFQEIDLPVMLEPVLLRYQLRAAKAELELSWELPPQMPSLKADSGRLTQVVTNLLENSVRYTDPGGRIVLSVQNISGWVQIVIDDSLPGVPEGAHARLFERLYRVDQARSRASGGSGLGLSICLAMIKAHGGNIEAAPSPLGGVRMVISLPLAAARGKEGAKGEAQKETA